MIRSNYRSGARQQADAIPQRSPPTCGPTAVLSLRWVSGSPGVIDVMAGRPLSRIWKRQTTCRRRRITRHQPDVDPLNSLRRACDNPDADAAIGRIAEALSITAVGVRSCHVGAYGAAEAKSHRGENCCNLVCHGDFKSKCASLFLVDAGALRKEENKHSPEHGLHRRPRCARRGRRLHRRDR